MTSPNVPVVPQRPKGLARTFIADLPQRAPMWVQLSEREHPDYIGTGRYKLWIVGPYNTINPDPIVPWQQPEELSWWRQVDGSGVEFDLPGVGAHSMTIDSTTDGWWAKRASAPGGTSVLRWPAPSINSLSWTVTNYPVESSSGFSWVIVPPESVVTLDARLFRKGVPSGASDGYQGWPAHYAAPNPRLIAHEAGGGTYFPVPGDPYTFRTGTNGSKSRVELTLSGVAPGVEVASYVRIQARTSTP